MMLRRSLSLLLCAVLTFSLCTFALPETALANEIHTGVFVGGTEINRDAYYVNDGAGGITTVGADASNYNVHYADNGTLTLKDAFITNNHQWNENLNGTDYNRTAAIFASNTSLTINLEGRSIVRGAYNSTDDSDVCPSSAGIYVNHATLTTAGAGTLIASGGAAKGNEAKSYGMYGSRVNISGGTLIVTGGSAKGNEAKSSGVNGSDIDISNGTVIATGGTVSGDYAHSNGVNGSYVNISGGTITATGGSSKASSYGIYGGATSDTTVLITGGMITATGGSAKFSCGVFARTIFEIGGGTLITTGGSVSGEGSSSHAVAIGNSDSVVDNGLHIYGGLLVARSGDNTSKALFVEDQDDFAANYSSLISFAPVSVDTFVVYGDPNIYNVATTPIDCTDATPTLPTGAAWNSDTKTLTLNNFIIAVGTDSSPAIKLPDGATLAFADANVVSGGDIYGNNDDSCGIFSDGSFTVNGSGNLIALGGESDNGGSYGMYGNDVTFESGRLTAIGGTAGANSCGVGGSSISMEGAALTAIGGTAVDNSCGVGGSSISMEGAALTAIGGTSNHFSFGMGGDNNVIHSGTLTAIGGTAGANSCGANGNNILSGDAPKFASLGGTANGSHGIFGGVTVSGDAPELVTMGGTATGDSCGVVCIGTPGYFTVSGNKPKITVIGGEGGGSRGVHAYNTDAIKLSSGYIRFFGNSIAFNQAPDMSDYRSYNWTASDAALQNGEFPNVSYPYSDSHKYVSFAPGSDPSPTVTSVAVTPPTASAAAGESLDFTATVTGDNPPTPQTIKWSVSGNTSDSTTIDANGRLTIDADEWSSTLTVKAASILDPSKSATATVTVTTPAPAPEPEPEPEPSDSDGGSSDYTPASVTVYNDPSQPSATVWLSGSGLTPGDLLVTERNPQGSAYKALLKLADSDDVFNTYNIYLRSGKKSSGSAMYLTFDLDAMYAGQDFTLVHQKADGTYEYFYDTADANGDLSFGPLYELSPFMLVKGRLAQTAFTSLTDMPKTGDSAQPALVTGIVLLMAAASLAGVALRKRRD